MKIVLQLVLPFVMLLLALPSWALDQNSDILLLQNAAVATGNGTPLTVDHYSTVVVELTVSTTATVTWEGSTHTTFSSIPCTNKATGTSASTATVTGMYQCDVAGLSTFRARVSSYTSGTVTAAGRASTATSASSSTISGGGDASAANQSTMITALQLIDDDQTGASLNHHISNATTEDETEIKATAGRLLGVEVTNTHTAKVEFRCANLTAANTAPGSSAVFYGKSVPGAATGAGVVLPIPTGGVAFSTALTCWLVLGDAETDVAEVPANKVTWNVWYK